VDAPEWRRPAGAGGCGLGTGRRRSLHPHRCRAAWSRPWWPTRTACMPSLQACNRAAGTGTASAHWASAVLRPHAHRAGGRRKRRKGWSSSWPVASVTTWATTPPGATPPPSRWTWWSSWATTSTNTPPAPNAVRTHAGGLVRTLGRLPRPLRALQVRPRAAGRARRLRPGCWSGTTTRSRTTTPACKARTCSRLCRPARGGLPGLLGTHAAAQGRAAGGRQPAHVRAPGLGTAGALSPAGRPPVPRPAGLPAPGARWLQHREAQQTAPSWPTRAARCWARRRSAGWPRAGHLTGAGTCWPSRR
jgi:hypothetical protein